MSKHRYLKLCEMLVRSVLKYRNGRRRRVVGGKWITASEIRFLRLLYKVRKELKYVGNFRLKIKMKRLLHAGKDGKSMQIECTKSGRVCVNGAEIMLARRGSSPLLLRNRGPWSVWISAVPAWGDYATILLFIGSSFCFVCLLFCIRAASVIALWLFSCAHTYLFTELSPSWGAVNCAAPQEPPSIYGTRWFNTVFTRALHWSLSWAISIQSTHPILSL
jgi:hypothetical protein